jgi:hypothetical protein
VADALGYALGVAVSGAVLTSRMRDTLPHDAARTPAGGGAGAVRGRSPNTRCGPAFASGLDSAFVTAGFVGTVPGALVLVPVGAGRAEGVPVTESAAPALSEEERASSG